MAVPHAGPPTGKATEAYAKYIITDMYVKAAQGMSAGDAVKVGRGRAREDLRNLAPAKRR